MIVGDTRDCMGNLDRRLSDIGDRVGNLERNVSDIGNRVGNLEKGLEAVNTKVSDIGDRVTRIEGRLDATASKEDLHRELTAMTWRLITFASSAGTALVAGTYYIARNVH